MVRVLVLRERGFWVIPEHQSVLDMSFVVVMAGMKGDQKAAGVEMAKLAIDGRAID